MATATTAYRVTVTTQAFPPHRQVAGLTDRDFTTFDDAHTAVLGQLGRRMHRRPPREFDNGEKLARWVGPGSLADGTVEIAIILVGKEGR